jgi:DNA-binding NarL/FixJ family response regulator
MNNFAVVLVLEDAHLIRRRIVETLSPVEGIKQILEAEDAGSALILAAQHRPHIYVLDIRTPGNEKARNGIDVLKQVKIAQPEATAIVFTNFNTSTYRELTQKAGADFFLDKSQEFDQLEPTVRSLIRSLA